MCSGPGISFLLCHLALERLLDASLTQVFRRQAVSLFARQSATLAVALADFVPQQNTAHRIAENLSLSHTTLPFQSTPVQSDPIRSRPLPSYPLRCLFPRHPGRRFMHNLYPDSILFLNHGALQPARRQIAPLNLDQRKPVITVEHHEIHPVN